MKSKRWIELLGCFSVVLVLSGCAHVISPQVRQQAAMKLSLEEVRKNPEAYKGTVVVWSGVILSGENKSDGTWLEILELPANRQGKPSSTTRSGGRFLAKDFRFLDTALYAPNRLVTVAGTLSGTQQRPLGAVPYVYPVVTVMEMHLWPEEPVVVRDPYYDCYRYPPIWWRFYFGHGWCW
ncbi:Slp family lipoprotein [Desulfosoma caldarium]|uniref:Outer membrane lipoprotein n=1 Tax=Desulfosoma caldarium TaxID=610254 RepID=A0A3N1VG15_9BACT|nr:Slp family lipoprotein [Desulfosoma caldarium]ROR01815.1 outer membrane lipoprotein [Desulfosoma caldarium]